MKVLFIGDVHIKHSNIQDVEMLIDCVGNIRDTVIDFIVVAGDVLDSHEKIDTQLMNRAYSLIKTLKKIAPTFILVGNHDYINNKQFLTDNHWMNGMKEWIDVVVVDKPVIYEGFVFVPYVYPGRLVEALDSLIDFDWKLSKCIFAHQEIQGCKMGAIISTVGDVWDSAWPQIISGHIHERQTPHPNVYYPGSVLNHAFGYDSQGLSLFTFRGALEFIEDKISIGLAQKKTLFIDVHSKVPLEEIVASNKFSVCGTTAEIAGFQQSKLYKNMRSKNVKVVFRLCENIDSAAPKYLTKNHKRSFINRGGIFSEILSELISKENDSELETDFRFISA